MTAAAAVGDDPLVATLLQRIQQDLDAHLFANACFLAERLAAHSRTEPHLYLLATCYYRSGKTSRAIATLEPTTRDENRYLLAVCCFQQGRLAEAENALLRGSGSDSLYQLPQQQRLLDNGQTPDAIPNGAAGLYLMGRICRQGNRRQQAIDCFTKCLQQDAFLWSAYEELCELGVNLDAARFFGSATFFSNDQPAEDDENTAQEAKQERDAVESTPLQQRMLSFSTPELQTPIDLSTPGPIVRSSSRLKSATKVLSHSAYKTPVAASTITTVLKKQRMGGLPAPPGNPRQRKSSRRPLAESAEKQYRNARVPFSLEEDSPSDLKTPSDANVTVRLFHSRNTPEVVQTPRDKPPAVKHTVHGRQELLRLLSSFGSIYQRLSVYLCREALELLERLPAAQLASGWARQQIGRAHFELADYEQAHEAFRAMHRAEPQRMSGLDLYSTTLWHLKKEVDLAYLAQQATDADKLSSEAWCVAGNCFSLQKEHDMALSFFQRAIQLDPSFTYAYTLSGHEYVANEDFDKAINCYRHAIRTDARHYNAWYGLGTIYYRQEKFEFAEYHFKRALEINPRSALLHCFLGMVLHSTHKYDEALRVLAIAGELQPLNPQARFQRANVLITQHRYEEALQELEIVRNFAPRESSVYFSMGKVAKKLGRLESALKFFTTALYFHPKDNNLIKAAIDKINEPDLEYDKSVRCGNRPLEAA